MEFDHGTSSPHHRQTNGKAEAIGKTVAGIIRKGYQSANDLYLILLERRNMPTAEVGYGMAQKLHGRRNRTLPLTLATALTPKEVDGHLREQRKCQKRTFDRGAQELPELEEGNGIWVECTPDHTLIYG